MIKKRHGDVINIMASSCVDYMLKSTNFTWRIKDDQEKNVLITLLAVIPDKSNEYD